MDHERPWRSCDHRRDIDIPGWVSCRICNAIWRVKDEDADKQAEMKEPKDNKNPQGES